MRCSRSILRVLGAAVLASSTLACPGDDLGDDPGLSEGETGAGDESGGPGESGQDLKTVDASSCVRHPDSLLAEVELQLNGSVLVSTVADARVLCPLVRDDPASDESWRVDVTAIDNNGEDDVSCTALARDLSGEVVAQGESASTSGSGGAQLLSLQVPQSEAFAYHYVDCAIPGTDARSGTRSGLASFVTSEVKTLEQANRKLYPGLFVTYSPEQFLGPVPLIDELGYGELYFPDGEGLTSVFLPVIRDQPDESAAEVRIHYCIHYFKQEGAFLSCVLPLPP